MYFRQNGPIDHFRLSLSIYHRPMATHVDPATHSASSEARAMRRREIFLSAVLISPHRKTPVRIRNLSRTGAMIQGAPALNVTDPVRLLRGSIDLEAEVIWTTEKNCGLKFSTPIDLNIWSPALDRVAQNHVDRRFSLAERTAAQVRPLPNCDFDAQARIADELGLICRRIDATLDKFSDYAPLVVRMAEELQELEILSQAIGHLQQILQADNPRRQIETIGMEELRRRLLRN